MKYLPIIALILATQAHAITAPDPDPTPEPDPTPSAPASSDDGSDGTTACEHYPSGECPGVWVNPEPVTDQFYGGKL